MANLDNIPILDAAGLRKFSLTTGGILAGLFGLLLPWLFDLGYPLWPWLAGGALVAWGLIAPCSLNPLYRGWMKFGAAIGYVNSRIILGLLFYLLILPAGLIMRLAGKDPLQRKPMPEKPSYRVVSKSRPAKHMEKPF